MNNEVKDKEAINMDDNDVIEITNKLITVNIGIFQKYASLLKHGFNPKYYSLFVKKIKDLRNSQNKWLEQLKKQLTYEELEDLYISYCDELKIPDHLTSIQHFLLSLNNINHLIYARTGSQLRYLAGEKAQDEQQDKDEDKKDIRMFNYMVGDNEDLDDEFLYSDLNNNAYCSLYFNNLDIEITKNFIYCFQNIMNDPKYANYSNELKSLLYKTIYVNPWVEDILLDTSLKAPKHYNVDSVLFKKNESDAHFRHEVLLRLESMAITTMLQCNDDAREDTATILCLYLQSLLKAVNYGLPRETVNYQYRKYKELTKNMSSCSKSIALIEEVFANRKKQKVVSFPSRKKIK
ncbi:MAG: hypothetical protein Q4G04_06625 [bacterium]|nr:hypothetical protein [bacterium]